MMDLFKQRVVTKKYIAYVHGKLPSAQGEFRKAVQKTFRKKLTPVGRICLHPKLEITANRLKKYWTNPALKARES